MFNIQDAQVQNLERELRTLNRNGFPFASRFTLNKAVFKARGFAVETLENDFVLKNDFTVNSIRFQTTRVLDIRRQQTIIGSTERYLEVQEFGGRKEKRGKEGVPIPTSFSAGQPEQQKPRTKLTRLKNSLKKIRIKNRRRVGRSQEQQNLVTIRQAAESSPKFVFLDFGRRKGIFKVRGSAENPDIKLVWSLTNQNVVVPPSPWLKPATDKTVEKLPIIWSQALRFQLRGARARLSRRGIIQRTALSGL